MIRTTWAGPKVRGLFDRPIDGELSVIENPQSGERIVIRHTSPEITNASVLGWELFLAPGGRVPSAHTHPSQQERFTVLEGRMRFLVDRRKVTVGAGQTVIVPPGTVHDFANAGPGTAHVEVETRPALQMEARRQRCRS